MKDIEILLHVGHTTTKQKKSNDGFEYMIFVINVYANRAK